MAVNYLLRMVERAAGSSALPTPRPPQQFYWPLPWEQPARFSAASALPSTKTNASSQAATTLSVIDREGEGETPLAPAIYQPVQDVTPPLPAAASARLDFAIASRLPESGDGNASARFDQHPTHLALIPEPVPDPANIFHENRHNEEPTPASPRAQGSMAGDQTTQDAFHFRGQEHSRGRTQPAEQPASEPIVEVNIARVEVRLDAPRPTEARVVPKANGFAEFESMRRYTAGPWSLRKR